MTGEDTNMLRLERFMSWYNERGESVSVRKASANTLCISNPVNKHVLPDCNSNTCKQE